MTDLSPVTMAAATTRIAIHNSASRNTCPTRLTDEVSSAPLPLEKDIAVPGDVAGLAVGNRYAGGQVSYFSAYLPVARKLDGTLTDW